MRKYIVILLLLLLSGCSKGNKFVGMNTLICEQYSNKHIISINQAISGKNEIVKALKETIGNNNICGRINKEVQQNCQLGNIEYHRINGKKIVSKVTNQHISNLLGSGGTWDTSKQLIIYHNKYTSVRGRNRCEIKSKQYHFSINMIDGIEITKTHPKGLNLYIKYDKSRYLFVDKIN